MLKLRLTVSELPVGALRYIAKRVCIGRTNGRVRNRRETHRARCVAIAGGERMQKKLARTQRNIKGQKRGCGTRKRGRTAELLAQPPSTKPSTQFTDRYSPLFVFTAAARESTWSIPGAHPIPRPCALLYTTGASLIPPVARSTPRYLLRSNSVAVPAVVLN